MSDSSLTPALASKFAALALAHVMREYPNKLDHVMNDAAELLGPRALHPIFYGSFDWHSCVHGYWLLARLRQRYPGMPESARVEALFDAHLIEPFVAAEMTYLDAPLRGAFERTYGWAWLLMLAAELRRDTSAVGTRWSVALAPLAEAFEQLFMAYLPKANYPIRAGTHANSAFAITLAMEYADVCDRPALAALLRESAVLWFRDDVACQAWEPSGDDFLSSALMEAVCMQRVLPVNAFSAWFDRFLPRLAEGEPATLFTPATVSDRTDGKIAHLDGLNLSRAWCWRTLAAGWDSGDPRRVAALAAADRHVAASLPHVAGDYMGEHWLATFGLLALS